jgi:hypothetical protein
MTRNEQVDAAFAAAGRKSSRSAQNGNCVEVVALDK